MLLNLRSGLRTASQISYLLGVLSIVFAMALSLINFPVAAQIVQAPQLSASGCSGDCSLVSSTFTNIGTADMPGAVNYVVLYRPDAVGAPWIVIGGGLIEPLAVGESQTVFHSPNNVGGYYRFRVSQPAGYSGPSIVYSNPCKFECVLPSPTPVTPTVTPVTPTNTPVTPTNTPVTPTNTPVTPTPQEPTATPVTPTPQEPTPTPQEPTATPVTPTPQEPTATPVTPTPQEPTPTPQEPTSTPVTPTPQEPTPTPQEPTSTPVTATPQEPTPTPGNPTATPETTTPPGTTTPIIPVTGETPTPQAPTNVPTLGAPGPVDPPAVLIPVTGGDMTPLSPLEAAQKVAFNLGLGLVGLGLVLQGIRRRF